MGGTQSPSWWHNDAYDVPLLWKRRFIPMILSGEKTATRRAKRPMVRVGRSYHIRSGFFDHLDERITVDRVYRQRLGEVTEADALREGASSLRGFIAEWSTLTGGWDPQAEIWVVEFHLDPSGG